MKALVLNGARPGEPVLTQVAEALTSELAAAGYEPSALLLSEIDISSCRGDFGCWVKTPGECVINDSARDIACAIVNSDLLVLLTPVTFGGYSSELKKALDRSISIMRPEFQMIGGEIHHRKRYKEYPSLFVVGVTPHPDEEAAGMFTHLVDRNAINLHSPSHRVVVLSGEAAPDEMRARIRAALPRKEAKR